MGILRLALGASSSSSRPKLLSESASVSSAALRLAAGAACIGGHQVQALACKGKPVVMTPGLSSTLDHANASSTPALSETAEMRLLYMIGWHCKTLNSLAQEPGQC